MFVHGLPEDDIAWTLDEDGRAVNRTHAARSAQAPGPALVDCPECHAVRMRGKPCVVCGWAPRTKGVAVDVIDGDLGLVQRDRRVLPTYASEAERQAFYQQLLGDSEPARLLARLRLLQVPGEVRRRETALVLAVAAADRARAARPGLGPVARRSPMPSRSRRGAAR